MSKAKKEVSESKHFTGHPKLPFAGFSKYGSGPQVGGQKFAPKTFSSRPTFVTQHKGGGGK